MLVRKAFSVVFLALCAAVLAACAAAKDYPWVVKIDGTEISADMYVVAKLQSCLEAQVTLSDEETGSEDWINNRTLDYLKEYCFVEKQFAERGLELDRDSMAIISEFANQGWAGVADIYESNGLTKEYYEGYLLYLYKEQLLFNDLYMPGGEMGVSRQEIDDYLNTSLCNIQAFTVPKVNDDGTPLTRWQRRRLQEIVTNAVQWADGGRDMARVAGQILPQAGILLGSFEDYSDGATFLAQGYLSRSAAGFPKQLIDAVFSRPADSCMVYEGDEYYYVFKKRPLTDNESEYLQLSQNAVNTLKNDEFKALIADSCRKMQVEENPDAISFYSSSKINITF